MLEAMQAFFLTVEVLDPPSNTVGCAHVPRSAPPWTISAVEA